MASLLSWLGNTAGKVERQVNPFDHGATASRPAPRPAPQRQPAPVQRPQFSQQAQQRIMARNPTIGARQIQHGVNVSSNIHAVQQPNLFKQNAQAFGLAGARTGLGFVQAGSGLVDLASPGKGTSRVSKLSNNLAVKTDKAAQRAGVNAGYKTFQAPLNVATFLTPGAVSEAVKGGQAAVDAAKTVPKVTSLSKLGAKYLPGNDAVGRIAGSAVKGTFNKSNALNSAGMTALQVGTNASKGGKTTPRSVATTAGQNLAFGGGMNLAGTVAKEGAVAGIKGAKAGVNAVTPHYAGLKAHQVIMDTNKLNTLHNALGQTKDTPVHIQNDTINGLHQIKQDHGLDFITGSPESRRQRISQYLEQNGEAIPQLQAHQQKMANVRNTAIDVQNKFAPGLRTNAVNDAGESLGMNGKPLKAPVTSTKPIPVPEDVAPETLPVTTKLVGEVPESGALANDTPQITPADHVMANTLGTTPEAEAANRIAAGRPKLPEPPKTPKVTNGKPKVGVSDKKLQNIQMSRKAVVNYTAEEIRNASKAQAGGVRDTIGKNGVYVGKNGLPEDHRDLPIHMRSTDPSKNTLDVWATNLGYHNEDELLQAIADNKANKPLSKAESVAEAEKQLASGQHPYSADFKQIEAALKQRQDELSQYPNGKYRQVKVTDKPQKMTDAELQSLSQTPEGVAKKTTNKVTVRNEKKVLRNSDAERQVQAVLKKGGSTNDALDAYMKSTGVDLQTAVADVKRVAKESNLGFSGGKNPLIGSIKLPKVQAGDHAQAFLNADYVKQHETAIGQKALDAFNGLSEHDKTLLQAIEKDTVPNVAKKANDPAAFTAAEKQIRTYYDTRHAYDNALGIDVGYRQNYLRQLFAKAEEEAKAGLPDQMSITNGNKRPGYTQHRQYDTLNTHVGSALERDIHGSSTNHAKLAYSEGLHQAYPEKINSSGQLVRDETGAYRQLTNRYGEGITAQKDIANKINSRSFVDTENKFLQKYDKVNAGLKYVKLGGGAFHAVTEAGNFIGQQLTSGKLFTEPGASGKVLKTFFSPKTMDREIVKFRDNGTLDKASLSGLKIMAKDILADADIKLGGKISKYSGIQALHDATFQREIPYAKLKLFEQKTKGLDVHNPEDLAKMRSISHGINDLFGGINRDIQGIRPKEFKVLQRFVLATDFTEGKIKTALRTVNITDTSPAAGVARQAVFGKVLLFGALAAGAGTLAGDYQGKSPKDIALDIASKLADPKFKVGSYSVAFPSTHVAEFSRPLMPLFKNKTGGGQTATVADRLKGVQKYATNRFAAVPSEALQLVTNKDAMGNRIYGKDYKFKGGENIGAGKAGLNVASGFTPIPVSQGIGVGTGKVNIPAAVANVAGLRVTNDDQYNQDATPVQIKTGDNPVTLPKDKAIAYNKAVADQQATLDKQLIASTQYKSASPDDQKAMKSKLHGYITDWQQRSFANKNNIPINKAASNSVNAVSNNTLPDNLAKGVASNSTKDYYKSPDAEYKALLASSKTATYNSPAAKITADAKIAKAKVGSAYDKSIRDAYDLSNAQLYDYVHNDPNGNDIVKKVLAYSQALKDAGITSTAKFKNKYGQVTLGKASGGSSGGRRRSSGRTAKVKTFKPVHISVASKSIKAKSVKAPSFKAKRSAIPKLAKVQTPKVTRVKKGAIA